MRCWLLTLLSFACSMDCLQGQTGGVRLLPEAGLSYPIGDFSQTNAWADPGYQVGLHFEKMWGAFGMGLYGGYGKNDIQYTDALPTVLPQGMSRVEDAVRYDWQQVTTGLGPVLQWKMTRKFAVAFSVKGGLARFTYPDFFRSLEVEGTPPGNYTLFDTRNEIVSKSFHPVLLSALRLNIGLTDRMGLTLSGDFRHVRDVQHAYTYLDGDFHPGMTNEELIQALNTAPTVQEIRRCHFNSVGATLGLSIQLGGKSESGEKMAPPVPSYPADGAILSAPEAGSLTLEWLKESPGVEGANYNLWLYQISASSEKPDPLLYKTKVKKERRLELPEEVKLETGQRYRWKVQAVDDRRLKACPVGCYSEEAIFEVSSVSSYQYYQLMSQDEGNYVEAKGQLRVVIPMNIMVGGKMNGRIYNQKNETVLTLEDLSPGRQMSGYSVDQNGRVTVDIGSLPTGYYLLEVQNEQHRKYFLRFKMEKSSGYEKD